MHREANVSLVIAAQSPWLRHRLQQAAGGETLLLYLCSCPCCPPLISRSPLIFCTSPQAVSHCAPLSIWNSVPVVTADVCVCMQESQIKLLLPFGAGGY